MKLHTVAGSPNCRKVAAVIDHLGLAVEVEVHEFAALRQPGYLAVNPNGMVPALVDGDYTLWESNAIMQYLAEKAGDAALFPRDPRRRAEVTRWQSWEQSHFNRAFGTLAFEVVAKAHLDLGPPDAALVASAQAALARFAPVLEGHLAGRRYLVGDGVTIADYAVITFEGYRTRVPFDWSAYPRINAYFDRLGMADPWQRTAGKAPATKAA